MSFEEKLKSVKNDFLADVDAFQKQDIDHTGIHQKYLARNGLVADLLMLILKLFFIFGLFFNG